MTTRQRSDNQPGVPLCPHGLPGVCCPHCEIDLLRLRLSAATEELCEAIAYRQQAQRERDATRADVERLRDVVEVADAWEDALYPGADVYHDELPVGMTLEERNLIRAVRDWRRSDAALEEAEG